jgi:hypothetical protein
MKRILMFCAVFVFLAALPVYSQIQTGSILVKTTDQQGGTLPAVTVTISSPVLVSESLTGVTNEGGVYRFPALAPGTYSVKLESPGFQTLVRENVIVIVGQTTPLDLQLKVSGVIDTITVTEASPTIDTTSANVKVNIGETLLQETPGGRDIWALLEGKVPSLVMSRPDVGGTSGGLQGSYSARGTTSAQNSQFLNGVNVGDPAAIGAAGYYYDFDAFEDIQVSTGAHDISVPTGGVFLNMVTKTGGDRWSGRTTFTWLGKGTQGSNIGPGLYQYGFAPEGNKSDFVSDVDLSAGGPLVKNKLRFFGSFRDWRVHQNVPVSLAQSVLDQTNITSGLGNVSWQLNSKNRVTGFYSRQRYSKPNRLLNSAAATVKDSTVDEEDVFDVYQGTWNSILTPNFFIDARFGLNKILFPTYFNGGNQESITDTSTGIIYGNNASEVIRHRDRYQANATAQYYRQGLGGRHEFKFGFDYSHAITRNETHRVDDVSLTYDGTGGGFKPLNVTLFATPQNDATALNVLALFVQDSYSLRRLTFTAGIRWETLEGYLPAQSSPPSRFAAAGIGGFAAQPRSYKEIRDVVLWHTAGPRFSGIYDLRGNGKTALKASYGRYYYILSTGGGGVSNVNRNANYSETYGWNDANGDHKFQIGEQTGPPTISAAFNPLTGEILSSIDPNFRRPYTDEYTVGGDHELMADLRFSAVFTYRREKNLQASLNPDNPYATTPTVAVDPGPLGTNTDPANGSYLFFQRTSTANRLVITNDPTALQSYKGLELTVTKRMTRRWQMLAGYTRSRNRLDYVSVNTSPNFLINANGVLDQSNSANSDRPNLFKLAGTYILPWHDVLVSSNLRSESGPPVTRQISKALAVGGSQTINLEPLGNHRLPLETTWDMRFGKQFNFEKHQLEADVDVDNITNAAWVWQVRTLTTATTFTNAVTGAKVTLPQFLAPTAIQTPRTVVFRVSYKF